MTRTIRREEIKDGKRKITLSVTDFHPVGGQFEVKAVDQNDGELEVI